MTTRLQPLTAPVSRRPARALRSAALVTVVGLLAAAVWAGFGLWRASTSADNYPRASLPGAVTVTVHELGTQYVYYEGAPVPALHELGLHVTGPTGDVAVRSYQLRLEYDAPDGQVGTAVATFQPPAPGRYTVSGDATAADAALAVGDSITGNAVHNLIGPAVLAAASIAAAALVLLARRPRTR